MSAADKLWTDAPAEIKYWVEGAHCEVADLRTLSELLGDLLAAERRRQAALVADILRARLAALAEQMGAPDFRTPPRTFAHAAVETAPADG